MATERWQSRDWTATRDRLATGYTRLSRWLFGDSVGVTLFVGGLWLLLALWQVGVFITDTYTLANALVALSEGHLAIREAHFGSLAAPGVHAVGGSLYGRNYGQVVASLPLLWALQVAAAVADLRIALLVGWCLLALVLSRRVGRHAGRQRTFRLVGAVGAFALFVVNLALVPESLPSRKLPLLALQGTAVVAACATGVLAYRLVAALYGRRLGVAAGVLTIAALPVGFWSHVAKRHVFTTATALGVLYAYHRSRDATDGPFTTTGYRALAYALVGLYTWVQAAEGFLLFLGLFVVDSPRLVRGNRRATATVAVAFLASLVPFFLTNYAISGTPYLPPRLLPAYDPIGGGGKGATAAVSSGPTTSSPTGTSSTPFTAWLRERIGRGAVIFDLLRGRLFQPLVSMVTSLEYYQSLRDVYLRSGWSTTLESAIRQPIDLTVLESAPVLGASVATVAAVVVRLRDDASTLLDGVTRVDVLAVAYVVLFTAWYSPYLPAHAQVTVRYLLVVYPLLLYVGFRQRPVRRALDRWFGSFGWAYAAGVLVGTQLFVVAIAVLSLGRGEAFQLHARLALALAATLALSVGSGYVTDRADLPSSLLMGVAAAAGTAFLVLAKLRYFSEYGTYLLPVARFLSDVLALA